MWDRATWWLEPKMTAMTLPGVIFDEAKLGGAHLTGSMLASAQFKGARLDDAGARTITNLSYCNLRDADFSAAYRGGGRTGANLSYVKFYGSNAKIAKATLTLGRIQRCIPRQPRPARHDRRPGDARRKFLGRVSGQLQFQRSSLMDCLFNDTSLYGADFTDTELYGTKFANAWIPFNEEPRTLVLDGMSPLPSVKYGRTRISANKTNTDTSCPDLSNGPCNGAAWKREKALPDLWKYEGTTAVGETSEPTE
jgi:hypothetical protein